MGCRDNAHLMTWLVTLDLTVAAVVTWKSGEISGNTNTDLDHTTTSASWQIIRQPGMEGLHKIRLNWNRHWTRFATNWIDLKYLRSVNLNGVSIYCPI